MTVHVSPSPTDETVAASSDRVAPPAGGRCGRGWLVGAAVLAVAVFGGTAGVRALTSGIGDAATAELTAERIVVSGEGLSFPIDPAQRCLVFNNFGGHSRTFGSGGHQGVDVGAEQGQEVYAVEDGVLYRQFTDLGSAAGFGWGLHGESDTKYRYYHLAAFADGLVEGQRVLAGQLIGYVGDTGNATPGGYHLHFEVRPGPDPHNVPVDPVPLLDIPRTCTVYPRQGGVGRGFVKGVVVARGVGPWSRVGVGVAVCGGLVVPGWLTLIMRPAGEGGQLAWFELVALGGRPGTKLSPTSPGGVSPSARCLPASLTVAVPHG